MSAYDHWHRRLSLEQLGHQLTLVPMLVICIPLILGIVLADSYVMPISYAAIACVCASVGVWIAIPSRLAYGYGALALLLLGYIVADIGNVPSSVPYDQTVEMRVGVVTPIAQREGYAVAEGHIEAWCDDDVWHDADERVQLWLRSDSVAYGDRLHLVGVLRERISRYEGYDELMHRRGFRGGVSVSNVNILGVDRESVGGIRRYVVDKLSRYAIDSASNAVVVAMVAGSRHAMPPSLSDAYAVTGLAHLMAVSGLHLGIVLIIVSILLIPLSFARHGHLVRHVIVIVVLWLFVAISGASPSVVRAAIMLTILQLSRLLSEEYNSINALAATVFAMLLYDPDYLYDISFQLSVLAVVGIIIWGVPLMRIIRAKNRVLRWLLITVIIGVAASLWTMPLISSSFGRLALIGVILTPFAMLCSYVIVTMGIFTIVLPHPLAYPFAVVGEWAAKLQNFIVECGASLRFASVEFAMSGVGVFLCYAIFVVITLSIWSINRKKLITLYIDDKLDRY